MEQLSRRGFLGLGLGAAAAVVASKIPAIAEEIPPEFLEVEEVIPPQLTFITNPIAGTPAYEVGHFEYYSTTQGHVRVKLLQHVFDKHEHFGASFDKECEVKLVGAYIERVDEATGEKSFIITRQIEFTTEVDEHARNRLAQREVAGYAPEANQFHFTESRQERRRNNRRRRSRLTEQRPQSLGQGGRNGHRHSPGYNERSDPRYSFKSHR